MSIKHGLTAADISRLVRELTAQVSLSSLTREQKSYTKLGIIALKNLLDEEYARKVRGYNNV